MQCLIANGIFFYKTQYTISILCAELQKLLSLCSFGYTKDGDSIGNHDFINRNVKTDFVKNAIKLVNFDKLAGL